MDGFWLPESLSPVLSKGRKISPNSLQKADFSAFWEVGSNPTISANKRHRLRLVQKLKEHPSYYLDMLEWSIAELHDRYMQADNVRDIIFYGYLYQERKCFGLDYNDLIVFTLYVFERFPDICLTWQQRLEYIMIDEFQDIDALQYRLMEVLQGYHKNLFVVGDPDQTIYSWRGADVKLLLDFDKRFPGTRTIMMLENHRSVPQVLAVANSLIAKNHMRIPKDLVASRRSFGPTVWHHAVSPQAEAAWIAEGVAALHGKGVAYRDMAVLYRAHYASRSVEEALLKADIPYSLFSGVPFFGRSEIKDAVRALVAHGRFPYLGSAHRQRAQAQSRPTSHGVFAAVLRRARMHHAAGS